MRAAAFTVLLVCAPLMAAEQGVTVTSKVTHDGKPATVTSYFSADHLRWSGGEGEVIIDAKAGQMIALDNNKKTYFVTTRADIDSMTAAMKERMNSPEMKRAQEQLKNLPPEQRKQMEAMMGSMFSFDAQKVGTSRKIAGYKCDDWVVTMGTMSRTEECLTNELAFAPEAWDMYHSLQDLSKGMMAAMGSMGANLEKMQEQARKMKGVPLYSKTTVNVMGRQSTSSTEVIDIKRGALPSTAWDIPAGYTKTENPMRQALSRKK